MSSPEVTREARARRAYELGRIAAGVRRAWPVAALGAFALLVRDRPTATLATSLAMFALVVGFVWRGGALARGVGSGLLAGVAPLVLPVVARALGPDCEACDVHASTIFPISMAACLGGGLLAGVYVGWRAARLAAGRPAFLLSAGVLAALSGSLGCAVIGIAGIAGMGAGLVLGAVPTLVFAGTDS